jgi:hypothetical protein
MNSPAARYYGRLKPGLKFKQTPDETPLSEAVRRCFEAMRDGLD